MLSLEHFIFLFYNITNDYSPLLLWLCFSFTWFKLTSFFHSLIFSTASSPLQVVSDCPLLLVLLLQPITFAICSLAFIAVARDFSRSCGCWKRCHIMNQQAVTQIFAPFTEREQIVHNNVFTFNNCMAAWTKDPSKLSPSSFNCWSSSLFSASTIFLIWS